jgi:hypothetical protein
MYFNEAFEKFFVGTQTTVGNANANLSNGFITTAGLPTKILNQTSATTNSNYGVGTFGMFDAKTQLSVNAAGVSGCCPLFLASASVFSNDAISPTLGGIKETVKSRKIDPNKVVKFYRVDPCAPTQQVVHIGTTKYTKTLSPLNPTCQYTFLCNETYSIRIDIKGSPALRAFNHNLYREVSYFTGCCAGPVPTPIDSTLVMIGWANVIINDPYLKSYLSPIVYDQTGTAWYAPGTNGGVNEWDSYTSPGYIASTTAGIRLLGAYVSTTFLDCTFQYTDHYEIEPIRIYVELIDFVGDPCTFGPICVITECPGQQGMGFGEKFVRDLIMAESYRQNFFHTDLRIREITQGNQELNAISRGNRYYRYCIAHVIPYYGNNDVPTQEQYLLSIATTVPNPAFETFMSTWLSGCPGQCNGLETISCTPCTPLAP